MLLGLSKLHKKSSLSTDEKSRLKTLALQDDKKVVSAFQAFEADKDENELLDTLKSKLATSTPTSDYNTNTFR